MGSTEAGVNVGQLCGIPQFPDAALLLHLEPDAYPPALILYGLASLLSTASSPPCGRRGAPPLKAVVTPPIKMAAVRAAGRADRGAAGAGKTRQLKPAVPVTSGLFLGLWNQNVIFYGCLNIDKHLSSLYNSHAARRLSAGCGSQ